MAEGIGVAATGGTNADGSRWVMYDAGAWEVFAVLRDPGWFAYWSVHMEAKGDPTRCIDFTPAGRDLTEQTAYLVAEAVAVAVAHVLGIAEE